MLLRRPPDRRRQGRPRPLDTGSGDWRTLGFLAAVLAALPFLGFAGEPPTRTAPLLLTNAAALRALKPWEIARTPPVRLEGVVTFSQVAWQMLFLQDASGGCYILPASDIPELIQGSWIRVEGAVAKGRTFPFIEASQIERLPESPRDATQPRARFVELSELAAAREDAQWVETTGVVRSVTGGDSNWVLELGTAAAQVEIQITTSLRVPPPYHWLNAAMRVRGVCTVIVKDAQPRALLHTARLEDFSLERASPSPLFHEPWIDPGALPRRLADATNSFRVRVRGQVWFMPEATDMYVGAAAHGIRLRGPGLAGLTLGDEIEAAGFLTWADGQWELANAEARRMNVSPPPNLVALKPHEPVPPPDQMKLIRLDGRVTGWKFSPSRLSLKLLRPGTGESVTALISEPYQSVLQQLKPGGVVQVSGWWQPRRCDDQPSVLLCRTAADFETVRPPNWWTPGRIATALALAGGGALLLLGWVAALRRQVHRQTGRIRDQLASQLTLEQRFRELFEHAHDAILILDDSHRIIELNPSAARLLETPRNRLLAQSLPERLTETDAARFRAYLNSPTPAALPISLALRPSGTDSPGRTLEITSCQQCTSSTGPDIQVIARDISQRLQKERESIQWHREFARLSRNAGMAEAAGHVLHNVGNVLNSVNVSASLMLEQLRTSNSRFLARAARLLSEHKDDAGDFLKNDPKGKQLPAFFEAAADDLIREQSLLAQETENLRHNVEHLKQIVARQQFRPSTLDIDESLVLPDVVDDALRMVSSSLDRHQIEIVRQFESVPPVLADRHKVLQILVDLINNAKQALKNRADGRQLHLRIVRGQSDRVRVEVIDNGAGIRAENLVRIFKYDTATKDAGFCGLHSGANAAREMGGSLSVVSDGPGTGSTFILELPDR